MLTSVAACSHATQPTQRTSAPDASVSPTPSPTEETPTGTRHLSDYVFGGHFGCRVPFSRESPRCQSSYRPARDFIWNHWREQKRAYVVVRITSPDSAANVHIFVEPDESDLWRIVWRWENIYCVSCPGDKPGTIYQSPEMRSIEQRRETDRNLPLGMRYLVFRDAHGNAVERL